VYSSYSSLPIKIQLCRTSDVSASQKRSYRPWNQDMRATQRRPLYEWLPQSSVSVGLRYVCIAARGPRADGASPAGDVTGAVTGQPVIRRYRAAIPKQEQSKPFVKWSCSYCTVDLISWSVHCTMNLQRRAAIGVFTSLFNGRSAAFSAMRQVFAQAHGNRQKLHEKDDYPMKHRLYGRQFANGVLLRTLY
jgi:hypothetical protein